MATKTFNEYYNLSYLNTDDGKNYEPKTNNRFVVYISELPAAINGDIRYPGNEEVSIKNALLLSLQDFQRPTYSVAVKEVPNFNSMFYLPGKVSSEKTIQCTFLDFFSPSDVNSASSASTASIIYRWFNLVSNQSYDSIGFKDYFTTSFHLFMSTPTGVAAEHWKFYEVWPTTVAYGDLKYSDSEMTRITVTFKYERARLISEAKNIDVKDTKAHHYYENKVGSFTSKDLSKNY